MKNLFLSAIWLIILAPFVSLPTLPVALAEDAAPCPELLFKNLIFPKGVAGPVTVPVPITTIITEQKFLQTLDRSVLKAVQKGKKKYSYLVDSTGTVHVFEGPAEIPPDALWMIENETTSIIRSSVRQILSPGEIAPRKSLQKFIVQEAGDLVYDKEGRKFALQSKYKLGGSDEGMKDAVAYAEKNFPDTKFKKPPDSKNSYERVLSCLDLANREHSGENFIKTTWTSGNINFAMWEVAFNPLDNVCDWEMAAADYMGMAVRTPTSAWLSKKLILDGASNMKLFSARLGMGAVHVGTQSAINHGVARGTAAVGARFDPEQEARLLQCQKLMAKQGSYNWGSLVIRSAAGFAADQWFLNDAHRVFFDACKRGGAVKLIISPTVIRLVEKNAMNALYWIPRHYFLKEEEQKEKK